MAELHDIRGIGPATAVALADHGLTSVKKLAKADLDAITAIPGFGPVRAAAVRAEARAATPGKAPKPPTAAKAPEPAKAPKSKKPEKAPKGSKSAKTKKKLPKGKKKSKKR